MNALDNGAARNHVKRLSGCQHPPGGEWDGSQVFGQCLGKLEDLAGDGGMLVWGKDDDVAMDFVASVANIRAHIFGIAMKTRFDMKSMAGYIIPAIATSNAVIAGLVIMEALKVLNDRIKTCQTVYLNRVPDDRQRLLVPCMLDPPNPECYVCTPMPGAAVVLNCSHFKVGALQDKVLESHLAVVAPDGETDDGKGTITISSVQSETEENLQDKVLESHLAMVAPDGETDDGKGTIIISSVQGETEENQQDKVLVSPGYGGS